MDIWRATKLQRLKAFTQYTPLLTLNRGLTADALQTKHHVQPPQPSATIIPLEPHTLNDYSVSIPPNSEQLRYANAFFAATGPTLLFSAAHFRSLPPSPFPEVAFLGRSNVGKSSLLNAIFGRTRARDARVSKRPGMTKTMNGFGVPGPNNPLGEAPKDPKDPKALKESVWKRFPRHGGLVVMDMPGYGMGSREEWGKEVLKYLETRRQLRRTFVLVDCDHGLKTTDLEIVTHLRANGIPFHVVLSKVDKILYPTPKMPGPIAISNRLKKLGLVTEQIREKLNAAAGDGRDGVGDIFCCSAEKGLVAHNQKLGVNEVRWAVLTACGLESDVHGLKKRRLSASDLSVAEDDTR